MGKADWIMQARMETLRDVGGCISPFNAWLLLRGIRTLALRVVCPSTAISPNSDLATRVRQYQCCC